MLDLLLISNDTSQALDNHFYLLEKECSMNANLSVYHGSGRLSQIVEKCKNTPKFILIANDLGHEFSPIIKGITAVKIPVGLMVHDVHRFTEARRHFIRKNQISYIFSTPHDSFLDSYPEYKEKMNWLPHFIDPLVYKDYELKKDLDLLMMGAVNEVYPLREKILEFYQNNSNFCYHPHPGYEAVSNWTHKNYLIGENYAREINRAKIFFTCPSVYHYPVMKYFEVLACNTLLLAPTFKELEDLGFIPGTHFVAIDEHNFMKKARYYLEHEAERKKIAAQGFNFIHRTHTLKIRASQLIKRIEAILEM